MTYGVRVNTENVIVNRIQDAMSKEERPAAWTAAKAGISPSTFARRMKGEREFKVSEIASVAKALGVAPCSLMPREFALADSTTTEQEGR